MIGVLLVSRVVFLQLSFLLLTVAALLAGSELAICVCTCVDGNIPTVLYLSIAVAFLGTFISVQVGEDEIYKVSILHFLSSGLWVLTQIVFLFFTPDMHAAPAKDLPWSL